jgi:DNA polymerase-3 subunit epsilon
MKITCIDFETANPFWGSICAAGVAVIDGNTVTDKFSTLIKPHKDHGKFNRDNIRVHGIKPEMVESSPEFPEFYPSIKVLIEGGVVAAHNSTFDVDCIRDAMTVYGMSIPSFEHICTCEIAQKVWGQELDGYTLKKVNTFLGYKFNHHDAGEDALAAANIIIKAMEKTGIHDIRKLAESIGVKIRRVSADEPYELSLVRQQKKLARTVDARKIKPETSEFDEGHPLHNREMVFTGDFSNGMSRREVMQAAANKGAKLSNYVRAATHFLVVGGNGSSKETTKTRRAKKLQETGSSDISILTENQFLSLLSGKKP